jgi:hypothetical protein
LTKVLITEQRTQAIEETFLVDARTGEIIPVYNHETRQNELSYKRNSRAMTTTRNSDEKAATWIRNRKLKSISDVRSAKDLSALIGDYKFSKSTVTQQGIELLHSANMRLTDKAVALIIKIIQNGLVGRNFAIVSNEDLQKWLKDNAGNYQKYLKQLEDVNVCKVRTISKQLKLIEVNPIYGYKGHIDSNEGISNAALDAYYFDRYSQLELSNLVEKYEDGWLEAA